MVACLIIPRSLSDLVDYWKANEAMLNYVKVLRPDIFERIKTEFTTKKNSLKKD